MRTGLDRPTSRFEVKGADAVLRRLRALGACPAALHELVAAMAQRPERAEARSTLQVEDEAVPRPRYLLSGWACRFRYLPDGRRQIFDVVLPGDGVGVCLRPNPLAMSNTVALTAVTLGDASPLIAHGAMEATPGLAHLLHAASDDDARRLLDALVRLGRMTALERLSHLLLTLHDRLAQIDLAIDGRFHLPLTQETLADMLGLSVVHINRTLQELRRQRLVILERGVAHLPDRAAMAQTACFGV